MAYTINKFNGEPLITLQDASIDTSTALNLVGRSYVGYGELQNENFVHLMENFANDNPPARPINGQTWFDTQRNLLNVYDSNKWVVVGAAILSEEPPAGVSNGSLWFKTLNQTLHIWNGTDWVFIGPETADGFGITRARSTTLLDSDNIINPVIFLTINNSIIAIVASRDFTINPAAGLTGFSDIVAGINVSSLTKIKGELQGISSQATRLQSTRTINGIGFDGTSNIVIKAATPARITSGDFINGSEFDGSTNVTWNVDATSANVIGKIVTRNSQGGFAASTITADLAGNVTAPQGTSKFDTIEANRFVGAILTGNADSATRLRNPRKINNVDFNGTADITITSSAQTLFGTFLNSGIKNSALETLGTLTNLSTLDTGIVIGTASQLRLSVQDNTSTIRSITAINLVVENGGPDLSIVSNTRSLQLGGPNEPAVISNNLSNLGISTKKFNKVHANSFEGNATSATVATSAQNLLGGATGSIAYQIDQNDTRLLPIGSAGEILQAGANGQLFWSSFVFENLTPGQYLTGASYNTQTQTTWSVDASTSNTAGKIAARDSNGDLFAATFRGTFQGTTTTHPNSDNSNKLATTAFVKNVLPILPLWAGQTSAANVIATYANNSAFPIGTKVAFWETRFQTLYGGNGSATFSDLYRRVLQKVNNVNGWVDVGG